MLAFHNVYALRLSSFEAREKSVYDNWHKLDKHTLDAGFYSHFFFIASPDKHSPSDELHNPQCIWLCKNNHRHIFVCVFVCADSVEKEEQNQSEIYSNVNFRSARLAI